MKFFIIIVVGVSPLNSEVLNNITVNKNVYNTIKECNASINDVLSEYYINKRMEGNIYGYCQEVVRKSK